MVPKKLNSQQPALLQWSSAYFLIIHGSRDPRPQAGLEKLVQQFDVSLSLLRELNPPSPDNSASSTLPLVGMGLLEFSSQSLDQQIRQFGESAFATGLTQVQLLPLFLLPGKHVMEDLPAAVELARQSLDVRLELHLRPYLGSHPGITDLLADQMATQSATAWILLSHGSRRQGGNLLIQELASTLGAVPAYWSVVRDLEMRIMELMAVGHYQIGILPYFLFSGSITDAITQQVQWLRQQFSQIDLKLARPLEPNNKLVSLIVDLIQLPACTSSIY